MDIVTPHGVLVLSCLPVYFAAHFSVYYRLPITFLSSDQCVRNSAIVTMATSFYYYYNFLVSVI